jgi:hypothetical protein
LDTYYFFNAILPSNCAFIFTLWEKGNISQWNPLFLIQKVFVQLHYCRLYFFGVCAITTLMFLATPLFQHSVRYQFLRFIKRYNTIGVHTLTADILKGNHVADFDGLAEKTSELKFRARSQHLLSAPLHWHDLQNSRNWRDFF